MKLARLLARHMPHLSFAVWDLSEFMPSFHNVRRNMVFIECEETARMEVIRVLASDTKSRGYLVFSGERKPKAVNEEWASGASDEVRDVIVVMARKDFKETRPLEGNIKTPVLERKLVDLIAYSLREWLPIPLEDAVDAFVWQLKSHQPRVTVLQRYATRRYLGWFLDIALFKLSKRGQFGAHNVDPRYLELGERYERALKKVAEL